MQRLAFGGDENQQITNHKQQCRQKLRHMTQQTPNDADASARHVGDVNAHHPHPHSRLPPRHIKPNVIQRRNHKVNRMKNKRVQHDVRIGLGHHALPVMMHQQPLGKKDGRGNEGHKPENNHIHDASEKPLPKTSIYLSVTHDMKSVTKNKTM